MFSTNVNANKFEIGSIIGTLIILIVIATLITYYLLSPNPFNLNLNSNVDDNADANANEPVISSFTPRLVVPLYIYPDVHVKGCNVSSVYYRVGAAMKELGRDKVFVILNPANGTDSRSPPNSDWTTSLDCMKQTAGNAWSRYSIMGYVYTKWGDITKRPENEIRDDLKGYTENWGTYLSNFFFDEVSTDSIHFDYYTDLVSYANLLPDIQLPGNRHFVMLNPGTTIPRELADIPGVMNFVDFEGPKSLWETKINSSNSNSDSDKSSILPSWYKEYNENGNPIYPPGLFTTMVLEVPNKEEMEQVVDQAINEGYGNIFITQDTPDNDQAYRNDLPIYWDELITKLKNSTVSYCSSNCV